jgi:methanogen homoisocitrate dehydrogenase
LCIDEPVHRLGPNIQEKGIANLIAAIRSAAMMLAHLGLIEEGKKIEETVRGTLAEGMLTPNLSGKHSWCSEETVIESINWILSERAWK